MHTRTFFVYFCHCFFFFVKDTVGLHEIYTKIYMEKFSFLLYISIVENDKLCALSVFRTIDRQHRKEVNYV